MSAAGEDDDPIIHPAAPPPSVRELMDLDLDLEPSSWPFDPIAAFVSSPPPATFLLSSSSSSFPSQSMLQSPFPRPQSPLWLFDDRATADLADCPWPAPAPPPGYSDGAVKRDGGVVSMLPASEDSLQSSCVIKERMTQALRYFKESTDQHVLVQVWAPMKKGDRHVLTTSGQPFVLDPQSTSLLQYRMVSLSYMFSLDEDNEGYVGLPGRVFKQKLPEWSPNVQYYSGKEYPRRDHALRYDVQGSLALPVFEPSGQACVGVVELIMTSSKIHYAPDVDKVCKALEAANLKSSEILEYSNVQICNEGRQAALAEILEILTVVCEAHKLPLAQTWVPCRHRSVLAHGGGLKKSCSSFDGSCMGQVCMSTTDVAFYVIDPHMWGFRDACVEHHLQKGQGVAGRAFESCKAFFCADVTQFCKTEYPLVHYARMFGLSSCLAICLQSTQSGEDNYILEFFLPPKCKDSSERQALVDSISTLMKQCYRSLKVVDSKDLHERESLEIIDMLANENGGLKTKPISSHSLQTNNPGGLDGSQDERNASPDVQEQPVEPDVNAEQDGKETSSPPILGDKNNAILQRRRGKAEKSISLQVLQQYFAGSLKDAAKSLGVCPTTMKRICRQHGISRWPSRKINKVNRSLSKLKRVLESVRGAEGAFNLTSLSGPIPAAVVGPIQNKGSGGKKEPSPRIIYEKDGLGKPVVQKESVHYQTGSQPQPGRESDSWKTRSSSEGSLETPCRDSDIPAVCTMPEAISVYPEQLLSGMLMEDSGSSKDLRNLCEDDTAVVPAQKPTQPAVTEELRTVTIKACYKEDITRFRLLCTVGMAALNDEVGKRLKLEVGTFDIKYLDDDHEWVVLVCDADLEECIEISRSSGVYVIRLTVHDIVANLGSSCESSPG